MKAIYSCISKVDFMLPAAKLLAQSGIEPVYWSANLRRKQQIKDSFPKTIFHDQKQALAGIWPEETNLDNAYHALTPELIQEYHSVQLCYMEMATTRAGGNEGFDWYELSNYYYAALAGSIALIEQYKPDLYIGITPPHYIFNYVLYEVCQRNNIKTLTFVHTHLPGRSLLVDTIKYEPNQLIEASKNLNVDKKTYTELERYLS